MPRAKKQNKHGDCYEAAGKFMMHKCMLDPDNMRYTLVHAEVAGQGPLEGLTYGHGFVVDTEAHTAIDKSNGRNLELPKDVYYMLGRIDQINNTHEYTYREMQRKITESQHWGPWDLETSSGL